MDFTVGRALCKHMLAADPFDRFADHAGGAKVNQDVAHFADRRIGGNAAGGIAAAAFNADEELRRIEELLLLHACFHGHISCGSDRLFNCFQGAALILDSE